MPRKTALFFINKLETIEHILDQIWNNLDEGKDSQIDEGIIINIGDCVQDLRSRLSDKMNGNR